VGVQVIVEYFSQPFVFFEINVMALGEVFFAEFFKGIRFTHLPGAFNNKRMPVFIVFPFQQSRRHVSFHGGIIAKKGKKCKDFFPLL